MGGIKVRAKILFFCINFRFCFTHFTNPPPRLEEWNDNLRAIQRFSIKRLFILPQWLTLEDAKHGDLHVRLQWYKLTADPNDLQQILLETQLLRVTTMSSAVLSVFIDSARHLKVHNITHLAVNRNLLRIAFKS